MSRVSNIAHLPTKPDHVAKAGRRLKENQDNQASSLQLHQNQRENKKVEVKTSVLA